MPFTTQNRCTFASKVAHFHVTNGMVILDMFLFLSNIVAAVKMALYMLSLSFLELKLLLTKGSIFRMTPTSKGEAGEAGEAKIEILKTYYACAHALIKGNLDFLK